MVLDFQDESLTDCLNDIISGLLPHENYDPKDFGILYPMLKQLLDSKDVHGLYFAFYWIFDRYFSLANSLPEGAYQVRITSERFSNALSNNLPDIILEPQMDVDRLMAEEGKSSDINLPSVQDEIMGTIYSKAMALYDTCFGLAKACEDAMSRLVDLKDIIKANLIETGMGAQRVIMSTGLREGRRFYRGPSGWLDYVQNLSRDISEMEKISEEDLVCDSLDLITSLNTKSEEMATPLAGYGIPQLDDLTPMLHHRFVVMVARENTGKTKVCIHLIAKLIRAGVKPFFACGESSKETMFNNIVSSYIYQEYHMFFREDDLISPGFDMLSPEDKQIVNTAKARVASSGLVISKNLAYDNVMAKISHYYSKGCEAFFIDHSQSLRGRNGRKISDLVTTLALDCRELKNEYPIYIFLTSQPSANLKDLLQKDQTKDMQISPTAQSSAPSYEADELFILSETEFLKTQNLLSWTTYKRRGGEKPKPFYILKHFEVSAFEYDAKYQGVDAVDSGILDGLIDSITGTENDEEEEDGLTIDF